MQPFKALLGRAEQGSCFVQSVKRGQGIRVPPNAGAPRWHDPAGPRAQSPTLRSSEAQRQQAWVGSGPGTRSPYSTSGVCTASTQEEHPERALVWASASEYGF